MLTSPVELNIWPMPKSINYGKQSLLLSKDFALDIKGNKYSDSSSILNDGFSRLLDHNIDKNSSDYHSQLLKGLLVVIFLTDDKGEVLDVNMTGMFNGRRGPVERVEMCMDDTRGPTGGDAAEDVEIDVVAPD
ncbi:hypothetical protein Syun_014950 [Stephania yunnanensis]|uniref:Uncharacterized protein n=1 Tax=Stephania yunnanensis TaxID=152371 RepID=A0AAP0JL56_9MAGN